MFFFFFLCHCQLSPWHNLQSSTNCLCVSSLYEAGTGARCQSSGFAQDWCSSGWSFTVDTNATSQEPISSSVFRFWSRVPNPAICKCSPGIVLGLSACTYLVFWLFTRFTARVLRDLLSQSLYCKYTNSTVIRYDIIRNMHHSEIVRRWGVSADGSVCSLSPLFSNCLHSTPVQIPS